MISENSQKQSKVEDLIALAEKYGCFRFSDMGFNTKSGVMFKVEVDFRKATDSVRKAKKFLRNVYDLIIADHPDIDCFMGIPDTGSMIAMILNVIHQEQNPDRSIHFNMVRSEVKNYIKAAPVTVQPVLQARNICLIEDDVVTGHTLIQYLHQLKCLPRKRILVYSLVDRQYKNEEGKTVAEIIKEEFNYPYQAIITLDQLEPFFQKSLT